MTPYFLHSVLVVYYFLLLIYLKFIFIRPSFMNTVHDNLIDSLIASSGRYLTSWNIVLQAVYFSIALLDDTIVSNGSVPSKVPVIRRIRDYVFCSFVFPTTLFVGILFWSLAAIDMELIFPKIYVDFLPSWLNHVLHTNIMVFIILEILTTFHQYPSVRGGLSSITVMIASYFIWTLIIYLHAGFWVYPVLEILSWPWRTVFFFNCIVGGYVCYFVGQFLNNAVWAERISQLKITEMRKTKFN